MAKKYTHIRVLTEDIESMRGECKELLFLSEPVLKKLKLSDSFMFHRLVRFYKK